MIQYVFLALIILTIIYVLMYDKIPILKSHWVTSLILGTWILIFLYLFIYQIVIRNWLERKQNCMLIYQNPEYKNVPTGAITTTYYNEYYDQNMDLYLADY